MGLLVLVSAPLMAPGVREAGIAAINGKVSQQGVANQVQIKSFGGDQQDPNSLRIVMADGTVITMDAAALNLAQNVETVGLNGTTDELIANLISLVTQLRESGKIDEAQANLLYDLANRGHNLAAIQAQIENQARQAKGSSETFATSQITFKGKNYTVHEAAFLIGGAADQLGTLNTSFDNLSPEVFNLFYDPQAEIKVQRVGVPLLDFGKAYQSALESNALSDPAVKSVVQKLVFDIKALSQTTATVTSQTVSKKPGSTPDQFRNQAVSLLTNNKSASICQTGGGQDTGVYCPETQ